MTVLLKAFFPLHNPPELAPAAPQGVGAMCVCLFEAGGKGVSIHAWRRVYSGGCSSLDSYISAGTK